MKPIGLGSGPINSGLRILGQNMADRDTALERLSTGLRISRASDDPAGLISSEALSAALASLEAEGRALERSQAVVNTAEGAIAQISGLLIEAEGLAVAAANTAGTSEAEREAMQLEMDSILQTIDRIATGTEFNGQKLLTGGFSVPLGDGGSEYVEKLDPSSLGEVWDIAPEETEDGDIVVDPDAVRVNLSDVFSGGVGSLLENPELAQRILTQAREDVTTQLGALGAIGKNTIAPRLAGISTQIENLTAS
ncbi:MAG: flagellin, partial [Planctomycetota bacterium]